MTVQPWEREPRVGDIWVGEDDAGEPIFRSVTAVEPPPHDCDQWRIALDGSPTAHRGWWYGQGWEEVEES